MNLGSLVGQTLDSKYKIEHELGRGGMGAVYFATHIGTARPVALKVIVPQFMQKAEFVERFRREARAAGRLRHPNVVDVTDFGFAETQQGRVAYLVMEYLDGCTLGEILEEEKQLPLSFTLDIVEQICSAIQEAHEQGIIHRDLKPDNIWLEPNQRGGYTVKVLDFGIAKLEEDVSKTQPQSPQSFAVKETKVLPNSETVPDNTQANTIFDNQVGTLNFESKTAILSDEKGTLVQTDETVSEKGTAILDSKELNLTEKRTAILDSGEYDLGEAGTAIFEKQKTQIIEKEDGTKVLSNIADTEKNALVQNPTAELTRVGAVLGTPLYMSPEQCRGEKLSARSDIYSLAVIVYQMLGGETPFSGDWTTVMNSHKEILPPALVAKKVPRKVKQVIHSALSKNVDERPPTAEAFASELRSHSEGFGKLLQKALVIYSEHLPKFLLLALLAMIPHFTFGIIGIFLGILASFGVLNADLSTGIKGIIQFIGFFAQIFIQGLAIGTVTWIIAQKLAFPLRPISIRAGLQEAWSKSRALFLALTPATLLTLVTMCCFPLGIYFSTVYSLIAPSIMMENIRGKAAFRRSKELVNRSFWTALAISILIYFVPMMISATVGAAAVGLTKQFESIEKVKNDDEIKVFDNQNDNENYDINVGPNGVKIKEKDNKNLPPEQIEEKTLKRIRRETVTETIMTLFLTPFLVLVSSLTSVITALLYFKTRQAGGESMQDLLEKFEDAETPRSNWQNRIRERLQQSGRVSSENISRN
jgi:serine/threonine protein kinase